MYAIHKVEFSATSENTNLCIVVVLFGEIFNLFMQQLFYYLKQRKFN